MSTVSTANVVFPLSTVIPDNVRPAINSIVIRHPDYETWRTAPDGGNNRPTRSITKPLWVDAINKLGLASKAFAILASPPTPLMNAIAEGIDDSDVIGGDVSEGEEGDMEDSVLASAPASEGDESQEAPVSAEPVLDVLRPYVSSIILDSVSKALSPIVETANRKPKVVEVEVERIVYQTPGKPGERPAFRPASIVGTSTLGKTFGIGGTFSKVPVTQWNAQDAPSANPCYVVPDKLVTKIVTAMNDDMFVYLTGPAGTGKSTAPREIAAKTGRPFVHITFDRASEPTDLLGVDKLDGNQGMFWADGVLTKAMRQPGTIILLDEIMMCPPGITATMQSILAERRLTIKSTGEVVPLAKGVSILAADNTRGYGDDTGRYTGTMTGNASLVDRFGSMLVVGYMEPEIEASALSNHTGVCKEACAIVVEFVNYARNLPGFGDIPLSLRRMIAFVKMMRAGFKAPEAFEDTFLTRLPEAERESLRQAYRAQFKEQDYKNALAGIAPTASPSMAPEQVSARNAGFKPVENP